MWKKEISYWTVKTEWKPATVWKVTKCGAVKWLSHRDACLAYPDEIGTELDEALNEPDEEAVQSALERTITEALMVNPRTEYVRGFTFEWNGDNVSCSFIVKGIENEEFQVTI